MRHPALVRVFAVVLAILCLIMLAAGIMGLEKAHDDYHDNLAAAKKMLSDIDEYKTLLAENEGKESYDTVSESLTQLQEQHEETSAEHRTEIATYSATKGGIQSGVKALDEADAAMAEARAQFEAGKQEFEAKKAEFMKQYEDYHKAANALPGLQAKAAELQAVVDAVEPEVLEMGKQQMDAQAAALGNEEALLKAEEEAAGEEISEELKQKRADFDAKKAAFDGQYSEFMEQYNGYQQAVQALPVLNEQVAMLETVVKAVDPAILEVGKAQIEATEQALVEAEAQISQGEAMLYQNRALIWYELGKLEDQAAELEITKNELLQESEEISQKEQQSEEQKQREKRIRSLYLTYMDKPEIAADVDGGEDFVNAAEKYIKDFKELKHKENTYRGYACVLMVVSMLPCLICFLASYEIIKKPGPARRGAVIVMLCAGAATALLLYIGRGVSYSAAAVTLFAFIQVLVSGKKKVIKVK